MTRLTVPLALAAFAIVVPILALLARLNGESQWDDESDAGESCSFS